MNPNIRAIRMAQLEEAAKALTKNRMEARVVETPGELLELLRGMIPRGATVATGGSETLKETGVMELLHSGAYDYYYRGRTDEAGQPLDVLRAAFTCDWFLLSANAVTMDGLLYNVDGNSNRVAALCYGPKKVAVIAGYNKLVKDLPAAVERVRAVAAPANSVRLERKTPCAVTGRCADCASPERICCSYVVHGFQRDPERVKVFLLPDDFGF